MTAGSVSDRQYWQDRNYPCKTHKQGLHMNIPKKILSIVKTKANAFLITKKENVRYTSGFTGDDSVILLTKNNNFLITDSRYTEQADKECPSFEIINRKKDSISDTVKNLLKTSKYRLGIESHAMNLDTYNHFKKRLRGVMLVPFSGTIETLRYIKTNNEINHISKAQGIADKALQKLIPVIKPGMKERDGALELEYIMKKLGSEETAFPTIFLTGKNTSIIHGQPGNTKIKNGDFILIDFGACYNGYRSDMTRTLVMGKPDTKQKEIYTIVKNAQYQALQSIKAGIPGNKPDKAARNIIGPKGYNEHFGHGLGHGLGLEIHEAPGMGSRCTEKLKKGCVVTVEPGIYLPGWGGVRIEDTVVVTKEGCTVLAKTTKRLISL
jgi:Xaa-Pro aminopeptidase